MTDIDRDNDQFNEGVTHTVDLLAKTIGASGWVAGDGSEDYDEDLAQTLLNILAAKGLFDPDTAQYAALSPPKPTDANRAENILREFEELHGQITIDERKWLRDRIATELTPPEPTEGQAERVARAIYHVSCAEADDGERLIPSFEQSHSRLVYLDMARAAIRAMPLKNGTISSQQRATAILPNNGTPSHD